MRVTFKNAQLYVWYIALHGDGSSKAAKAAANDCHAHGEQAGCMDFVRVGAGVTRCK